MKPNHSHKVVGNTLKSDAKQHNSLHANRITIDITVPPKKQPRKRSRHEPSTAPPCTEHQTKRSKYTQEKIAIQVGNGIPGEYRGALTRARVRSIVAASLSTQGDLALNSVPLPAQSHIHQVTEQSTQSLCPTNPIKSSKRSKSASKSKSKSRVETINSVSSLIAEVSQPLSSYVRLELAEPVSPQPRTIDTSLNLQNPYSEPKLSTSIPGLLSCKSPAPQESLGCRAGISDAQIPLSSAWIQSKVSKKTRAKSSKVRQKEPEAILNQKPALHPNDCHSDLLKVHVQPKEAYERSKNSNAETAAAIDGHNSDAIVSDQKPRQTLVGTPSSTPIEDPDDVTPKNTPKATPSTPKDAEPRSLLKPGSSHLKLPLTPRNVSFSEQNHVNSTWSPLDYDRSSIRSTRCKRAQGTISRTHWKRILESVDQYKYHEMKLHPASCDTKRLIFPDRIPRAPPGSGKRESDEEESARRVSRMFEPVPASRPNPNQSSRSQSGRSSNGDSTGSLYQSPLQTKHGCLATTPATLAKLPKENQENVYSSPIDFLSTVVHAVGSVFMRKGPSKPFSLSSSQLDMDLIPTLDSSQNPFA
jgi:hypothetical protein